MRLTLVTSSFIIRLASLMLIITGWAAGCGDAVGPNGKLVGAPCSANSDCDDTCNGDVTFGWGMCTLACRVNSDCPSGALCVGDSARVCAVSCGPGFEDCASFGRDFICGGVEA